MKRWLFAVGTFLLLAVASAQADYVRVTYILGPSKNQGNQQMAGGPGGMMGMGMRGMMGRQGMGPGGMGPGGMGPGGMGPGNMSNMMRNARGMAPGGGPGGAPGAGQGRMMPGAPGGGAARGQNPPGFFPGQPTATEDDEEELLKATAVIEVKKWTTMNFRSNPAGAGVNAGGFGGARGGFGGQNPGGFPGNPGGLGMNRAGLGRDTFDAFYHDLVPKGLTGLYKTEDIDWERIDQKTVDLQYKARRDAILKGSEKSAANYQDLAKWVLNNGKVNEFPNIMEEWEKIDADSPQVRAFKKVKAGINRQIDKDDPGLLFWQNKLGDYRTKRDPDKYPHYVLLSSSAKSVSDTSDVNNRMKRLEDNYKAFFYWFTLQGKDYPVPDYRLVAVLVDRPNEFEVYHKVFDNVPLSDDGFFARRENLAFFSATPLDEVYDALEASMKDLWGKGWSRDDLLKGKGAPRSSTADSVEVIRNQVKALLLKALQDESELVAATHEGTLQLASVTGILPRTVTVPEWAQFGLASYFETSKGAWWPGTGAPNHRYLTKFKKYQDKKTLEAPADKKPLEIPGEKKPAENPAETALKKVITDQYFHEARASNQQADWIKARTMTWALTHYLIEEKFDALMNYYQELANLPRDMEFDEEILLGCFARAFKLDNPDSPGIPKPEAMQKFAQDWFSYMPRVQDQYSLAGQYEEPAKKPRGAKKKGQ